MQEKCLTYCDRIYKLLVEQGLGFMRVSKSQASDKPRMFESLAAYANMGDKPEAWRKFRLMYPDFFPSTPSSFEWPGFRDLTEWMYSFAENWWKDLAEIPAVRRPLPPLLWYRNRLRSVWAMNDQHGYGLAILLGFEQEAKNIAKEHPGEIHFDMLVSPMAVPGQPINPSNHTTDGGLPRGRPVINGVTGEITWEFGCGLQQAVYELMRNRWRARVCPKCGRFFVTAKTAQKLCSVRCSDIAKRERALAYWNETGKKSREQQKQTERTK
jgi:hypothetical protein